MYYSKAKFQNKTNVLECRVCEDVFTQAGERIPRLLYCGHTVCHSCLLRLPITQETILCPFDRQPTPVGITGVWGLKKNFALLELLERLEVTDKESVVIDTEVVQSENEVRCDEDESHSAVVYCVVCRSHLCAACSDATHATRTLAPHPRVPLSQKPRDLPPCRAHPARTAEFVCLKEECRSPTVCFLCKEYGKHKDHPHSLVEAEAEKLRTLILTALQRAHQFMDQMNQTVRRLEDVVMGIEGNGGDEIGTLEEARTRVESHFEELRVRLQSQEAAARAVVETHARERLATLTATQHDISTWLAQVVSVVVQCESALSQDDARLVGNGTQLKKAIEAVEKQHDQFSQLSPEQLSPDIPITFTKDNRVHIGPKIEMRVVALGLDGAGKTSILFKLKQNEFMSVTPTIGFNVETIEYKNLRFNVWDIGGQPKLRPLWKHYFLNTQAVVFVVDSSDKERLTEASLELAKLVAEKELKDAALLIFANKQDVDGSEGVESVTEAVGASKLCCSHSWHLQGCSAQTGAGLYQGLDWLSSQLVASPVTTLN